MTESESSESSSESVEIEYIGDVIPRKYKTFKKFFWRVSVEAEGITIIKDFDKKENIIPYLNLTHNQVNYRLKNKKVIDGTTIERLSKT